MVLNRFDAAENAEYGRKRGYTETICVRRPWRGRGLARALITRSLLAWKNMGMTEAAHGVDYAERYRCASTVREPRLQGDEDLRHLSQASRVDDSRLHGCAGEPGTVKGTSPTALPPHRRSRATGVGGLGRDWRLRASGSDRAASRPLESRPPPHRRGRGVRLPVGQRERRTTRDLARGRVTRPPPRRGGGHRTASRSARLAGGAPDHDGGSRRHRSATSLRAIATTTSCALSSARYDKSTRCRRSITRSIRSSGFARASAALEIGTSHCPPGATGFFAASTRSKPRAVHSVALPRALPQRPLRREHPRRGSDPPHRLGVRRNGRRLLRPRDAGRGDRRVGAAAPGLPRCDPRGVLRGRGSPGIDAVSTT